MPANWMFLNLLASARPYAECAHLLIDRVDAMMLNNAASEEGSRLVAMGYKPSESPRDFDDAPLILADLAFWLDYRP